MDVLYRTGETQQVDLLISYSWKVHLLIVVVCLFRNYVDSIFLFGLMFYTVDGYCQAKESIIPSMFHRFFIMTKIPVSGTYRTQHHGFFLHHSIDKILLHLFLLFKSEYDIDMIIIKFRVRFVYHFYCCYFSMLLLFQK